MTNDYQLQCHQQSRMSTDAVIYGTPSDVSSQRVVQKSPVRSKVEKDPVNVWRLV